MVLVALFLAQPGRGDVDGYKLPTDNLCKKAMRQWFISKQFRAHLADMDAHQSLTLPDTRFGYQHKGRVHGLVLCKPFERKVHPSYR